MITLATAKVDVLEAVQLLNCAAEAAALDYQDGFLRFSSVLPGALCRLPTTAINVLNPFSLLKTAERMQMYTGLLSLAYHCMDERDSSSLGGIHESVLHDFAAGALSSYPAESAAPAKNQKTDDGLMLSGQARASSV